ncbi:LpqB family beta-propeller domain-containing protein [Streptomyces sannanensis]|uniref:LpqB family beta-propeller domain-containing protein n=1 Tax=Streptomyces sannanensis TaxID=285536 RepID=A0ABP6SBL4_9ACTN
MPSSGDVDAVDASQRADSQVRVYGVPPREGAAPDEIVDGFLEAMTSVDIQFATARKYLTKQAARSWKPGAGVTVLADGPTARTVPSSGKDDDGRAYDLTGAQIAQLDGQHAYRPAPKGYGKQIHLVREEGPSGREWRIDALPDGLLLGQSDFQRIFRPVNKYYFAADEDQLVADPVYLRQSIDPETRMDPVTQSVKALLDGPTGWLSPVVDSRFPSGTALKAGVKSLAVDEQNTLKVPLNGKASDVDSKRCQQMAAQLLYTVRDLTSSRIGRVELRGPSGSLCVLSEGQADDFVPDRRTVEPPHQYYVDEKARLVRMPSGTESDEAAEPAPGPLGTGGQVRLRAAAVSRDERFAAGVSHDGHSLFVTPLAEGGEMGNSVVTSQDPTPNGGLSAPSWDGRGDLWVADRDPGHSRLLMLDDGAGQPVEVGINGLNGGHVEELRVSADGVRIALLVSQGGKKTLQIGLIERIVQDGKPKVSVIELHQSAPQMEVSAMSWAGPSRLVVVGREAGGVEQLRYIQTDGSTAGAGVLPGANQVKAVAAADDDRLPLLALSEEDGIVKLPPGENWKTVDKEGSSPVYPG